MTHQETLDEIQRLLKRPVTFINVTFKNAQGFVPEYFNFMAHDLISNTIADTEEESATKLLDYLKSKMEDDTKETP